MIRRNTVIFHLDRHKNSKLGTLQDEAIRKPVVKEYLKNKDKNNVSG
jgi:hypothetical protein